jgi:sugar (pentulose or hexulose) kinase
MKPLNLLAFDFGASSGRAISGSFDGTRLFLQTVHHFPNGPVASAGHLYWDVLRFVTEMHEGIRKAAHQPGGGPAAMGIDTWGVDFGLLDAQGELLGNPYHYRDRRTEGMPAEAFRRMPKEAIFSLTGVAFQPFNTLFQLLAMRVQKPQVLDRAATLLMMPDLLAYFLTGVRGTEYTDASTTQLLDARTRDWSKELLRVMDLPGSIFGPIHEPGMVRGLVNDVTVAETGCGHIPVVAVAGHDTASAVAAVPLPGPRSAYLSSGTWSLLGVEVPSPMLDHQVMEWKFTNEGGVGGTYRFLRNVMGLWILQECMREWDAAGKGMSYEAIIGAAAGAPSHFACIDPDAGQFYAPGAMEHRIVAYCRASNQRVPEGQGAMARCILESLALKYRWAVERLELLVGFTIHELVIVGGGARNALLNQWTANALHRPVIAGPSEATAVGNLLVQLGVLGEVGSVSDMRKVVNDSFPGTLYSPGESAQWDEAYRRFCRVTGN